MSNEAPDNVLADTERIGIELESKRILKKLYDDYDPDLIEAGLEIDKNGEIVGGFPKLDQGQVLIVELCSAGAGRRVELYPVRYDYEVKYLFDKHSNPVDPVKKMNIKLYIFDPERKWGEEALTA